MVWRLTRTRRAKSDAPTPLLLRISPSRFLTGVFTMSIFPPDRLKMDLRGEFEVARIAGTGNQAEGRVAEARVRIVQRRRIRHIEGFRAECKAHLLRNRKRLADHHI